MGNKNEGDWCRSFLGETMKQFKIYYTSDVHGYLFPTDYIKKTSQPQGLINVAANFDKNGNTIIIDGGDMYQGSPLLQYLQTHEDTDAVTTAMNLAGYDYVTLGNHDFNFGYDQLVKHLDKLEATVVAENVTDKSGHTLYPAQIKTLENGTKVGIIGLVTDYINIWEKPAHISAINIESPLVKAAKVVKQLRDESDVVIGVYHGGYERDISTGKVVSKTTENIAWELTELLDLDILLTGHQHGNVPPTVLNGVLTLQMPNQAKLFAEINGVENKGSWQFKAETKSAGTKSCETILSALQPVQDKVENWLDQPIAQLDASIAVQPPIELAKRGNEILQWIASVQLAVSDANITLVSLNNNPSSLPQKLTLRHILQNYPFDNTLVTKRVSGKALRASLEHVASYFVISDDQLTVDPDWLIPKVEHYNYDLAFGIDYGFNVTHPVGSRVVKLQYQGQDVQDTDYFTIAMNNYRAVGGGNYHEYATAETVFSGDQPIQEMLVDYFKTHIQLPNKPKLQFFVEY